MKRLLRESSFAAALFLLVACGGEPPATGCVTAAECADAQACVDGLCRDNDAVCTTDVECQDTNLCNGRELCSAGRCAAGEMAAQGTICDADGDGGTVDVCEDGLCAPGRCGDTYIDMASGEVCDDGNRTDGDGCDDCRFSCTDDVDCDDGAECTGVETCDAESHACVPGMPLAEGADCAGAVGLCVGDACLPRSCEMPEDCDDGSVCNGTEDCVDNECIAGEPLDCDDENDCTDDECSAVDGCSHRLIDADFDGFAPTSLGECGEDCDDDDRLINPASADGCDGEDNDCDGSTDEEEIVSYYSDCDGDAFAATGATSIAACAMPTPTLTGCDEGGQWTTRPPAEDVDIDCNDANPTVRPGQTFQTTPIMGVAEDVDFDYNCDSVEEPSRPPVLARCSARCNSSSDGFNGRIPECGEVGIWMLCRRIGIGACQQLPTSLTLGCR